MATKWEYFIVSFSGTRPDSDVVERLNELGVIGFELVSAVLRPPSEDFPASETTFHLKRALN